jgi:predicted DNA-binding protein
MLTVQFPDDLAARIAVAAARMGLTEDAFVREAVLVYLEDMEQLSAAKEEILRDENPDEPVDRSARERPGLGY